MQNKFAFTFVVLALAVTGVPVVCSAQCGPDFIEIKQDVPNTFFAPGANPGPALASTTIYRLKVEEERESWSTQPLPKLLSKRYYATLPTEAFLNFWRTSLEYAKLNNSNGRTSIPGNNVTFEMFQKVMTSQGQPLQVSFEESLAQGRSKFLTLHIRKWIAVPAAPSTGGFAPTLNFGVNAQPFEANNQYTLTLPFKVVERCQK